MSSLLPERKEGLCFILSAPAGTGKTTLAQMLMNEFPSVIASISFTTRKPREGETHGEQYHFISVSEFEKMIADADFLEYVNLYGNYYGTSRKWVLEQLKRGKHVFLVIDTQGAMKLKDKIPAIRIFVSPPSLDELRARLINRKTEKLEVIETRLEWAKNEMEAIPFYDYHIVNDDLSIAYEVLRSIIIAETHRM